MISFFLREFYLRFEKLLLIAFKVRRLGSYFIDSLIHIAKKNFDCVHALSHHEGHNSIRVVRYHTMTCLENNVT